MKKIRVEDVLLVLLGAIFVSYMAIKLAPYMDGGLVYVVNNFSNAFVEPLRFKIVPNTVKTVSVFLLFYFLFILAQVSMRRNTRDGEEYGSEQWATRAELKQYQAKNQMGNKILSENIMYSINDRDHYKNTNICIVGGSGTGKTRYYAKPNIMQANANYIVLDPKGELLENTGAFLESEGYKIKVLNLNELNKSNHYNPFAYIESEDEVQALVNNLWKNTTPRESKSNDPFWDNNAQSLLKALMFLLVDEALPSEQNFGMVMDLLLDGSVVEDQDSLLDKVFEELEEEKPHSLAVKYYRSYKPNPVKTKQNINQTLSSRIEKFILPSLRNLTAYDDINLEEIGSEEKVALFCITPENDTSYNFVIGMLYTQLFQKLYNKADREYGGRLPRPVHFIMDEFANVVLPDNFTNLLSTMRSKYISCSIILQNLTQLKSLYKEDWETITGNCSVFMFLGGQEKTTLDYVTSLLGKETIDTTTTGDSKSYQNTSSSRNYQRTGRELLTPAELRRMDNKKCVVIIQGSRPAKDNKYNLEKHPNYSKITDGGGVG
ncbi:VirD4-like conjugal transfer protein, CD1115 family, partial [Varibaculum cambriense]|uniref:VirD4-like conjugal transfer protein, CD1115 family n=1 Tax=Varibaculum cambriense TaxID=184870 RepID=UPI00255634D2